MSTSAAVKDDVALPAEPYARERNVLLALAITASLPRVLFGLTVDSALILDPDASYSLIGALRWIGYALDVACILLLIGARGLDDVVAGSGVRRRWAVGLAILELMLSLMTPSLFGILGFLPLGFGYTLPSFAATAVFAAWLATLLKPRAAMLLPVAVAHVVITTAGYAAFGRIPLLATAMGVVVAVEVMRARRSLGEQH